jgi:hypothetical protein
MQSLYNVMFPEGYTIGHAIFDIIATLILVLVFFL